MLLLPELLTLLLQRLSALLLDLLLDLPVLHGCRGRRELCRAGRQLQQRMHLGRKRGCHTRRCRRRVILPATAGPPCGHHTAAVWGV